MKHGLDNPWSLYDMEADPTETRDLAAEQPDRVKRMGEMFDAWKKRVSITKAVDKPKNL